MLSKQEKLENRLQEIIANLGGELIDESDPLKKYRLATGHKMIGKYSQKHDNNYCLYGMTVSTWNRCVTEEVDDFIFLIDEFGYVDIPIKTMREYLRVASTKKKKGVPWVYLIKIKVDPDPILYRNSDNQWDLREYYHE